MIACVHACMIVSCTYVNYFTNPSVLNVYKIVQPAQNIK